MNFKKNAPYISLLIIVIYWVYQLLTVRTDVVLPSSFAELAIRVLIIKCIHLGTIITLLYIEQDWYGMGFTVKNYRKQFMMGLLLGLTMFLLFNVGLGSILNNIFPKPIGSSNIFIYFKEPKDIYVWLIIGIFGGGFVEELMRIFCLTRFEKQFNQYGLYVALLISSVVFGIGHLYQGMGIAISTGLSGLVLGVIYIRRRSAIEVITIHAFSDILAILGAYKFAHTI
jgi:membrane protease YdiL (CAAX protease family)